MRLTKIQKLERVIAKRVKRNIRICKMYGTGKYTYVELGNKVSLSKSQIGKIVTA